MAYLYHTRTYCFFIEKTHSTVIDFFFRSDAWLPLGISGYLCGLFIKKTFGNNEYRFRISKVCDCYELTCTFKMQILWINVSYLYIICEVCGSRIAHNKNWFPTWPLFSIYSMHCVYFFIYIFLFILIHMLMYHCFVFW